MLFLGVLGALVLRAGFIAGGAVLIARFHWVLYLFGAFLLLTGIRMLRHRDDDGERGRQAALRVLRRVVPITETYDGQRFFSRQNGSRVATPLFAALVLVETADLVFAVDSIPAVFAVTQEPFLVFTSNVFAILGLRAMFLLLADLLHRFVYLKPGLAVILVGVGAKMLLLDIYPVPTLVSLAFIGLTLTVSVVASLRTTRNLTTAPPTPTPHTTAGKPR